MDKAASTSQRPPVVVGVDGSRSHLPTVDLAVEEAVRRGAPLWIVHVWTHPSGREARRSTVIANYAADREQADRRLAEALAGSAAAYPDVAVERLVLHDLDVAYTLERASQRGRLLIAGMGRNGRFAEMLYGSVGMSVVRRSACPVLLVPDHWTAPLLQDHAPTVPGKGAGRP